MSLFHALGVRGRNGAAQLFAVGLLGGNKQMYKDLEGTRGQSEIGVGAEKSWRSSEKEG